MKYFDRIMKWGELNLMDFLFFKLFIGLMAVGVAISIFVTLFNYYRFHSKDGIWNHLLFKHKDFENLSERSLVLFDNPTRYNFFNVTNIALKGKVGKLGAWYYKSMEEYCLGYVLYLHGRGGNRTSFSRVMCAQKICDFGFDVLAIDYRGFGDSDGIPDEQGSVEDSETGLIQLNKYRVQCGLPKMLLVWGHSLGSSIALELGAIDRLKYMIDGIVIESAFCSVYDEISTTEKIIMRRALGLYQLTEKLASVSFNNFNIINKLDCRLFFLHAKYDPVVSHLESLKLYNSLNDEVKSRAEYILLDERFGHNNIYRSESLQEHFRLFINKILTEKQYRY